MQDTLTNPIFWQGFAAALVLAIVAALVLLALIGRANDDIPLCSDRRQGDGRDWPGRSGSTSGNHRGPRSRRSELRGGPR